MSSKRKVVIKSDKDVKPVTQLEVETPRDIYSLEKPNFYTNVLPTSPIEIKNFSVVSQEAKEDNAVIRKLLPKYWPEIVKFEIYGVRCTVANSIRRVIMSEFPTKILTFDENKYTCNDGYNLEDYIKTRISSIPIQQNIPKDAKFHLNVINNTKEIFMDVKSRELNCSYCDEVFTLCKLETSKFLKIDDIYVAEMTAEEFGPATIAANVASIPIKSDGSDVEKFNGFSKTGLSTSISNPTNFRISITTLGTMKPKEIIKRAVNIIIERLKNVLTYKPTQYVEKTVKLEIPLETDTIGSIIMEYMSIIDTCTYEINVNKVLIIKYNSTRDDPIGYTVNQLIGIYNEILTKINNI